MTDNSRKSMTYSRHVFSVIVACANGNVNNQLRQTLKSLGFAQISTAPSHVVGMERAKTRDFTHVFFDAGSTDMPSADFVRQMLELDDEMIMVAVSTEPRVDDVFGLLSAGARGFLVLPFAANAVEEVLVQASEGPPLSEAVLNAPDRNSALVGVVLNSLYRVSVLMRQAREFPSAARELERARQGLKQSVEMAKIFCDGGDEILIDQFVEACISRANTASTRLGRTRKRLKKQRDIEDTKIESSP